MDGVDVHDYIFREVPADLLQAQLDTYFIKAVGKDPTEYIRRYSGRAPLLHIKDMHKDERYQNCEVGLGLVDWDAVFEAADQCGVQWYIVEQNCQERPAKQSVRMSMEYPKSQGIA